MRQRICILTKPQLDAVLAPQDRPVALDGTWDFSIEEYIDWRAEAEQVQVDKSVRVFDADELARSSAALAGALKETTVVEEQVLFRCDGEKRGSGGWGSTRWKRKQFVFMPSTLVYGEGSDCADGTTIPLTASRLERLDSVLQLTTAERSYLFRFDSEAVERQFEDAHAKAVGWNQTREPGKAVGAASHGGKMGLMPINERLAPQAVAG